MISRSVGFATCRFRAPGEAARACGCGSSARPAARSSSGCPGSRLRARDAPAGGVGGTAVQGDGAHAMWPGTSDSTGRRSRSSIAPACSANSGPSISTASRSSCMDEFAHPEGSSLCHGDREPTRKRVLWVGRGRGRRTSGRSSSCSVPSAAQRLQAAVMDMNASYELEVTRHCPNAAIVFDLFHVVAKYGREVIDRVRVDRGQRTARRQAGAASGQGRPLAAAEEPQNSLRPGRTCDSRNCWRPIASCSSSTCCKDDLKDLWDYRYAGWRPARSGRSWYRRALRSRIEPLNASPERLKTLPAGHPGPLPLAAWHQPARGHQQQDQGHQAHGLRLPRRRLLLPQDPRRLPRSWVMNRKKRPSRGGPNQGEKLLRCSIAASAAFANR